MLTWLAANIGTILIALALAAVVIGILFKLRKDKKKGSASCCGDCASCCCHCVQRENAADCMISQNASPYSNSSATPCP